MGMVKLEQEWIRKLEIQQKYKDLKWPWDVLHIDVDDLLLEMLRDFRFVNLAKEIEKLSDDFYYA